MILQYLRFNLLISNDTSSGGHTMGRMEVTAPVLSRTVHFNLIEQYSTEHSNSPMNRAMWTPIL